MATLSVHNLMHSYGEAAVLINVSLEIGAGSYAVLLGPSGSGKTTLLSVMGGFLAADAGRVMLAGEDVTAIAPAKRQTATVFQDYALFPHMTVAANVEFGLRMRRVARRVRREKALAALASVGLDDFGTRKPHELSGGQRQRVALARALVIEPKALLLDEPLGALDLSLRRQMQNELKTIQRRAGMTFVHVTHDQEEAMALADQVVVMNAGAIEDAGPPERVYTRPASRFTAEFVGESSIIAGVVTGRDSERIRVETEFGVYSVRGEAVLGAPVELAVRPEAIHLGASAEGRVEMCQAAIGEVVFQGGHKRIRATSQSGVEFLLKRPINVAAQSGEVAALSVHEDDLILLIR